MTAIAQPQTLGDLLKYEAPNLYSRETDTVAAGQKLALGTVVGRDTTSSKLKSFDPDATDGSEIAISVLAGDVDATLIDRDDALVIARHAIVARGALVWPTGISTVQKAAAIAQLTFLGVLVRDSA